jgi:hypothetical protein
MINGLVSQQEEFVDGVAKFAGKLEEARLRAGGIWLYI